MTQTRAEWVRGGMGDWILSVAEYNELLMWIWQAVLIPEAYLKAIGFFIGQGREQI